jgi:D-alanyl-lipoteichoic acid acyltransferase DltB (MBOAT superfamily)
MEITSWAFSGFVIGTAMIYYALPRRFQNIWLLILSYVFYITWAWQFALVLALVTAANFGLAFVVHRDSQGRRGVLWIGIALNILALAFFKYSDFFIGQARMVLAGIGIVVPGDTLNIILPIGLSYTVLQTISYLVDVYRGQLKASHNPVDFALYLAYFPKLISGPIERARSFLPKLAEPRVVDNDIFSRGGALIAIGLLRKIVIANVLARSFPDGLFESPLVSSPGGLSLLVWLVVYAVYLFNDFAGYTSIVRGVSLLFGIGLSPNFQTPFFARSFTEFWNQWHISLSQWLRDYVYFPVSRSLLRRKNDPRFLPNVIIPPVVTMLVSGLWHGATLSLLLWGLLHGLYQAIERLRAVSRPVIPPDTQPVWQQVSGGVVVFMLTLLAWVPFQAGTLRSAFEFYQGLLTWGQSFSGASWPVLLIASFALCFDFLQMRLRDELFVLRWHWLGQAAGLAAVIVLVTLASAGEQQPFIYQGF